MHKRSIRNYFYVPAAGMLLIAAFLKTWELCFSPFLLSLSIESRELSFFLIAIEFIGGMWLFLRVRAGLAKKSTVAIYIVFWIINVNSVLSGAESCGCLGNLKTSPIAMLVIDTFILIFLFFWEPQDQRISKYALLTVGTASTAFALLFFHAASRQVAVLDGSDGLNGAQIILIEPSALIGKPFPFEGLIEAYDQLSVPSFSHVPYTRIVFIQENCQKCNEFLSILEKGNASYLVIVIPPNDGSRASTEKLRFFKLSDNYDWHAKTPFTVELRFGIVIDVGTIQHR